jgi:hypothetical protein
MRYLKRITAIISLMAALFVMGATNSQAQTRRVVIVHRPVIWHTGFWGRGYYDPFYDPYYYDPYLQAQREKYYLEQDVKDKRKDLAKHQEKYRNDGYLTPKEQEKLAKDQEKYAKAVRKLNDFNRSD